jgi:hypothetical protein
MEYNPEFIGYNNSSMISRTVRLIAASSSSEMYLGHRSSVVSLLMCFPQSNSVHTLGHGAAIQYVATGCTLGVQLHQLML